MKDLNIESETGKVGKKGEPRGKVPDHENNTPTELRGK